MSETSKESPNRRSFIASSAAVGALSVLPTKVRAGAVESSVRPFHINIPEEAVVDLRRRINATKWPERENVPDSSQGVQLATIQKLARYWGKEYDWRKC